MGTNEVILLKNQAGIETTRGTAVAATRKVYAQITPKYERPLTPFRNATGTYEGRRRPSYGREKISFTGADEATYEDLPWWAELALKGGVTGVSDAGTPSPAYLYTFAPSLSTDDLKSVTLEFNEDSNPYESNQVMVNQMTLRMDSDNDQEPSWMLDLDLMGRGWTSTTYTGSIPDRATEPILARGTKLFIDDAGGTIGTTQVLGKFISASVVINNQIHFKAFAEDVTGVAANKVGRQDRLVDAQFTFEFDDDVEFAKYRSTTATERLIRIHQDGSQIHSGSPAPTQNKSMEIDLYGYWSSWSRGDREGNLTATFGLMGFYDTTAAKTMSLVVNNALATLA
jgi:hypothetical protein